MSATGTCEFQPKDYKSDLKPIWCPGCGDFSVVQGIYRALAAVGRPPHEIAFVSGIGCSSRIPGYTTAYGFNSVHGRALPIAQGIKLANPDLLVLAAGGDGDGFSIGGGHIAHMIRRNMDITYIVMDNQIYGLTKGQLSPTTTDLHFQTSGKMTALDVAVNQKVTAGQVLAQQDTTVLQAQLAQARAAVAGAEASLQKLEVGATSQTIAVSNAALTAVQQGLQNSYATVPTTLADAYAKANDAVTNQLAPIFSNAQTATPQLASP